MRKPILMMSNTSNSWELVGEKVRANSYFNNTNGLHTVSVQYTNFIGGFKLQGTLAHEPEESDWFDIVLDGYNCPFNGSYISYPKDQLAPNGLNSGDTGLDAFTFIGNFVYLRAVLYRDYISDHPGSLEIERYGIINKVLLSL